MTRVLDKREPVEPATLRATMGAFATGVAIVTTACDGEPHGMTVNSLTSVSLAPPQVLVCLTNGSRTADAVRRRGAFALHLLGQRQRALSDRFAGRGAAHFAGLDVTLDEDGMPLLAGGVGRLRCAVAQLHDGGDHAIVVGAVLACEPREGTPLVFHRGRYHEIHGEGHEAPWLW
ncbi:flavin reductase domain protein FMN-binding protein [Conexibacter woesei DSM 14684]|uniref:Flavin reductase domain protein FMN-binding protein n=2 Tax=Conexibacter TaxID=191494 RepID=D3F6X9_CONWI|nr:flavin reductase domain protein FMN-binding protein [Conexibacter woesei DSM 14684]